MVCTSGFRSEHFGSTALIVEGEADWVMERIENYFVTIGASIRTRKQYSIKARVTHPDGFAVNVSAKYYADVDGTDNKIVDILRRSGDALLFNIVYKQLLEYLGRGTWPEPFHDGQLCPRVVLKALPSPLVLPAFRLDPGGDKRKATSEPGLIHDNNELMQSHVVKRKDIGRQSDADDTQPYDPDDAIKHHKDVEDIDCMSADFDPKAARMQWEMRRSKTLPLPGARAMEEDDQTRTTM